MASLLCLFQQFHIKVIVHIRQDGLPDPTVKIHSISIPITYSEPIALTYSEASIDDYRLLFFSLFLLMDAFPTIP